MMRMQYQDFIDEVSARVEEIFPWDLEDERESGKYDHLLLDIRCPHEFRRARIQGSLNVPRGILEMSGDYGYEETVPELVSARKRRVVVICRSGKRSVLAAHTLQQMGFRDVVSLKTGLRGWNDYELPLVDETERRLSLDEADDYFLPRVSSEQLGKAA